MRGRKRLCLYACLLAASIALTPLAAFAGDDAESKADEPSPKATPSPQPPKLPFTISRETTYLTGPLAPDGTVDYVAALNAKYGKGVTPENNAAGLIVQALGDGFLGEIEPGTRDKVLRDIGATISPNDHIFVELDDFYWAETDASEDEKFTEKLSAQSEVVQHNFWRAQDSPLIARWLEVNAAPLDLIAKACERPKYLPPLILAPLGDDRRKDRNIGSPPMLSVILPGYSTLRRAAHGLVFRANLAAGEGRLDDAVSDIMAVYRLGSLIGQDRYYVARVVAIGMQTTATKRMLSLATSGRLSADQARRVLADWQRLPLAASPLEIMNSERFACLEAICWYTARKRLFTSELERYVSYDSETKPEEEAEARARDLAVVEQVDWDVALRTLNRCFDLTVEVMQAPPNQRDDIHGKLSAWRDKHSNKAKFPPEPMTPPTPESRRALTDWAASAAVDSLAPDLTRAQTMADQCDTCRELAGLALALAAYRAERGEHPEKLADLSPGYIKEIGLDVFSGKPYVYRRLADGYVLYSVGLNGEDDGGVDAKTASEDGDADDIVVFVAR